MHSGLFVILLSALLITALGGYTAARLIFADPGPPKIVMSQPSTGASADVVPDFPPPTLNRQPAVAR